VEYDHNAGSNQGNKQDDPFVHRSRCRGSRKRESKLSGLGEGKEMWCWGGAILARSGFNTISHCGINGAGKKVRGFEGWCVLDWWREKKRIQEEGREQLNNDCSCSQE